MEWYWYLLIIYGVLSLIFNILALFEIDLEDSEYFPRKLKENHNITWIGAIILWIFEIILLWLHYIILLFVLIFKGWKWFKEHILE